MTSDYVSAPPACPMLMLTNDFTFVADSRWTVQNLQAIVLVAQWVGSLELKRSSRLLVFPGPRQTAAWA
jgi:hypothetical protein